MKGTRKGWKERSLEREGRKDLGVLKKYKLEKYKKEGEKYKINQGKCKDKGTERKKVDL